MPTSSTNRSTRAAAAPRSAASPTKHGRRAVPFQARKRSPGPTARSCAHPAREPPSPCPGRPRRIRGPRASDEPSPPSGAVPHRWAPRGEDDGGTSGSSPARSLGGRPAGAPDPPVTPGPVCSAGWSPHQSHRALQRGVAGPPRISPEPSQSTWSPSPCSCRTRRPGPGGRGLRGGTTTFIPRLLVGLRGSEPPHRWRRLRSRGEEGRDPALGANLLPDRVVPVPGVPRSWLRAMVASASRSRGGCRAARTASMVARVTGAAVAPPIVGPLGTVQLHEHDELRALRREEPHEGGEVGPGSRSARPGRWPGRSRSFPPPGRC
jgi:hypothetical protein